jgi:hypothetical protein
LQPCGVAHGCCCCCEGKQGAPALRCRHVSTRRLAGLLNCGSRGLTSASSMGAGQAPAVLRGAGSLCCCWGCVPICCAKTQSCWSASSLISAAAAAGKPVALSVAAAAAAAAAALPAAAAEAVAFAAQQAWLGWAASPATQCCSSFKHSSDMSLICGRRASCS